MDQAPIAVTSDPGEGVGEKSFDGGEFVVADGKDAVGDQDVAQVIHPAAVRVRVVSPYSLVISCPQVAGIPMLPAIR